jgi:hypothetical protein
MIPRSLPFERDKIVVANKTGWDEEKLAGPSGVKGDVRTDAAYVKGPKARYVIAICARSVRDKSPGADNTALVTGAKMSRLVYDYFNGARSEKKKAPVSRGLFERSADLSTSSSRRRSRDWTTPTGSRSRPSR